MICASCRKFGWRFLTRFLAILLILPRAKLGIKKAKSRVIQAKKSETLMPHSLKHHCFPFVIHLIWIYVAHLYDSPTIDYQSTLNIYPAEYGQNCQNPFGRKFEAYRIRAEISAWKHSGWIFSLRKIQVYLVLSCIIMNYPCKYVDQVIRTRRSRSKSAPLSATKWVFTRQVLYCVFLYFPACCATCFFL